MRNAFVIVEVRESWYMLLIRKTLYCFSCGTSATSLLGAIRKLTKNYKYEEALLERLSHNDDRGEVAPAEFERRQRLVGEVGWKYEELVLATVEEAIKESVKDSTSYKVMHKLKALPKRNSFVEIPSESPKETAVESTPRSVGKKVLPRRIVVPQI